MLGKLCKQEFKAANHYFAPLYLTMLVLAVALSFVLTIVYLWKNEVFSNITLPFVIAIFVISLIAISLGTFLICIFRFEQTMVGNEGYLTHTLPVTIDELFFSRLIVAFTYHVISFLITLLFLAGAVLFILLFVGGFQEIDTTQIMIAWNGFKKEMGLSLISGILIAVLGIISVIVDLISGLLVCYLAIALAQCMKAHRILWTAVFYICINIGCQFLSNLLVGAGSLLSLFMDSAAGTMISTLGVTSLIGIVVSIAAYFMTRYLFTRHLNLE